MSDTKKQTSEPQSTKPVTVKRQDDSTITLTISVPWKQVEEARKKVIDELVKHVELPGFRKGQAPRKTAEDRLNKDRVNEETLKKVLPEAYVAAVKENNLNPIVNPQIHVEAFDEGTDLKFIAETAEEPTIDLKNYKDEVKKITAKAKIIVPGKEEQKVDINEILEAILKHVDVKVSKILVEHEANRLLSQMLDELKTLGMTLEQYLTTRGKTGEQIRSEYQEKAANDIKLEFILRKIADAEKITVTEADIQDALNKIQDPQQKAEIQKNTYMVSAIIRQQKTLDFLAKI